MNRIQINLFLFFTSLTALNEPFLSSASASSSLLLLGPRFWCPSLTFFAGGGHVVVYGGVFAAGAVSILALSCVVLTRLVLVLGWPRRLTGPGVGGVHAAAHAAAELQPPHVAHHSCGVEGLLQRDQENKIIII